MFASKCKLSLHNLIQRGTRVRTFNFANTRPAYTTSTWNSADVINTSPGIPVRVNISIGFRFN